MVFHIDGQIYISQKILLSDLLENTKSQIWLCGKPKVLYFYHNYKPFTGHYVQIIESMNKLILILITLNVSLYVYGQDPVKVYFEEHFQTVENKPTSYYRLYDINKSGAFVKDYHENILELDARINGLTDVDSLNKFIWFIRNEQAKINFEEYFKYVTG